VPEVLHGIFVILIRRAHEMIVGEVCALRKGLEGFGGLVAKFFGRDTCILCRALDLHAMLIGAGAEDRRFALEDLPSLEDVRKNHGIEVADMRGYIVR